MIADNALANSLVHWTNGGGDTGRRRVEHRSFLQLRFTHLKEWIRPVQIRPIQRIRYNKESLEFNWSHNLTKKDGRDGRIFRRAVSK